MSLERAYRNCKFCYSQGYGERNIVDPKAKASTIERITIDRVNIAMAALEEEIPSDFRSDNVTMVRKRLAYEALKVCANCHCEKAGLVELLEKELPKTFTPEKMAEEQK